MIQYIQFWMEDESADGLPEHVDPDRVYPYLRRSDSGADCTEATYSWALLAFVGAAGMRHEVRTGVLGVAGFSEEEHVEDGPLKDLEGWSFLHLKPADPENDPENVSGPFKALPEKDCEGTSHWVQFTRGAGGEFDRDLHCFRIDFSESDPVVRLEGFGAPTPASEEDELIVGPIFDAPGAITGLSEVKFVEPRQLRIAEAAFDEDGNLLYEPSPGFLLSLGPESDGVPPGRLSFSHFGGAGGMLVVNGHHLPGLPDPSDPFSRRLPVADDQDLVASAELDESGILSTDTRLRWELPQPEDLSEEPWGRTGLFKLKELPKANLRLGLGEHDIGKALYMRPGGSRLLQPRFTLPLVMGKPKQSETATARMVNAVKGSDWVSDLFTLGLDLTLPDDWDADAMPVLRFDPAGGILPGNPKLRQSFAKLTEATAKTAELQDLLQKLDGLPGLLGAEIDFKLDTLMDDPSKLLDTHMEAITFPVKLTIGRKDHVNHPIELAAALPLDMANPLPRLKKNRIFGYVLSEEILDLDFCAISVPKREIDTKDLTSFGTDDKDCDFYLDWETGECAFVFPAVQPSAPERRRDSITLCFPGGPGAFDGTSPADDRFSFTLEQMHRKSWPNVLSDDEQAAKDPVFLIRFGPEGVSFAATADLKRVRIDEGAGLLRSVEIEPAREHDGVKSRIVVIDNEIRECLVCGTMPLPGVESMQVRICAWLALTGTGTLPQVRTRLSLDTGENPPEASLSIGYLKLRLLKPEESPNESPLVLELDWNPAASGVKRWDFRASADVALSLEAGAGLPEDLQQLSKGDAVIVHGLDLRRLNAKSGLLPLPLGGAVEFDILGGLIGCTLGRLSLGWDGSGFNRLVCDHGAAFRFNQQGSLRVEILASSLTIERDGSGFSIKAPPSIGFNMSIGETTSFGGAAALVEDREADRRYFSVQGTLDLGGMRAEGLLILEQARKKSGRRADSIVIFGAKNTDQEIFTGVIAKRLGLGVGSNQRLAGVPADPDADTILKNIDRIKPGDDKGWSFVKEDGHYLCLIGTALVASNRGGPDQVNPYVASLAMSLNTRLDVVAAGRVWLSCSVQDVDAYPNNPALVGALVLSVRKQRLEAVVESRPDPFIRDNEFLQKVLRQGHVRLSFTLTPDLVDYYLEEISYKESFGESTELTISGSHRIAIFDKTLLMRANIKAEGQTGASLAAGRGGIDFSGTLDLDAGFGGLLEDRGAAVYAAIDAEVAFHVRAWIRFELSKARRVCGVKIPAVVIEGEKDLGTYELGLRGAVAVDDGGSGLSTSVHFETNSMSFGLELTAGFEIKPAIVDRVPRRVAAFEQALDSFKERALVRPQPIQSLVAFGDLGARLERARSARESWLHYRRSDPVGGNHYHLFLPDSSAPWFTPACELPATRRISEVQRESDGKILITTEEDHGLTEGVKVYLMGIPGMPEQEAFPVERISDKQFRLSPTRAVDLDAIARGGAYWYYESPADLPFSGQVTRLHLFYGTGRGIKDKDLSNEVGEPIRIRIEDWPADERHDDGESFPVLLRGFKSKRELLLNRAHLCRRKGNEVVLYELEGDDESVDLSQADLVLGISVRMPWESDDTERKAKARQRFLDTADTARPSLVVIGGTTEQVRWADVAARRNLDEGAIQVVQDPRIRSSSPDYWTADARAGSIGGLLPCKMADVPDADDDGPLQVQEIPSESEGESELDERTQILLFERLSRRIAKTSHHAGEDLDPHQQLRASRSALVRHLRQDLTRSRGGPEDYAVADGDDTGLIVVLPEDEEIVHLEIERMGVAERQPVDLRSPDLKPTKPLLSRMSFEHPRYCFLPSGDTAPGARPGGRLLIKLPVWYDKELFAGDAGALGVFQILRRLPGEESPTIVADFTEPRSAELNEPEQPNTWVLVQPYLFTDSLPVVDGQLPITGDGEIEYFIRSLGNSTVLSRGKTDLQSGSFHPAWTAKPELPFTPPPPTGLSLVLEAEDLVRDPRSANESANEIECRLIDLADGTPKPARIGQRPMQADDIEILVRTEHPPAGQLGWYLGEDYPLGAEQSRSGSRARLSDLDPEPRLQSVDTPVPATRGKGEGVVKLDLGDLVLPGMRYSFFIRRRGSAQSRLAAPLGHRVARGRPSVFSNSTRLRALERIEWIPKADQENMRRPELLDVPSWSASVFYANGGNQIQVEWDADRVGDGGAEIFIVDRDDPVQVHRQLCEVLSEQVFKDSRRDLADTARWVLSRTETSDRMALRLPESTGLGSIEDEPEPADYFVDLEARPGDVIEQLEKAFSEYLAPVLGDGNPTWQEIYQVLVFWTAAVHRFRRSPLNVEDPDVVGLITAAQACARYLLLGLILGDLRWDEGPQNIADALADRERELIEKVRALLEKPGATGDSEPERLETGTARAMAVLIARRKRCAEDMERLVSIASIPQPLNLERRTDTGPILRLQEWLRLKSDIEEFLSARTPQTSAARWLDERIAVSIGDVQQEIETPRNPAEAMLKLAADLLSAIKDVDYKKRLAPVVPQASNLAVLLDRLRGKTIEAWGSPQSIRVLKRPHHVLSRTNAGDGRVTSIETEATGFLPSYVRRDLPEQEYPSAASGTRLVPRFVIGAEGRALQLHSLAGGVQPRLMQTFPNGERPLDLIYHEGRHLILVEKGAALQVLDLLDESAYPDPALKLEGETPALFAPGPSGLQILATDSTGVDLKSVPFDAPSQEPVQDLTVAHIQILEQITSIAYDPESGWILAGRQNGTIDLWRGGLDGEKSSVIQGRYAIRALAFARLGSGLHFLSADDSDLGNEIRLWRPGQAEPVRTYDADFPVTSLVYDIAARTLAAGTVTGHVRLWNILKGGKPNETLFQGEGGKVFLHPLYLDDEPGLLSASANTELRWIRLLRRKPREEARVFQVKAPAGLNGIAAAAMPEVRSPLAMGVCSYLNLLERMGFALDIAAATEQNLLLDADKLHELIGECLKPENPPPNPPNPPTGEPLSPAADLREDHLVLVVRAQEAGVVGPNGDPPVAHSFVKLVVVPKAFHQALVTEDLDAARSWFDLRRVPLGENGAETLGHFGRLARYLGATECGLDLGEESKADPCLASVALEPAAQGWRTVAARGNRARSQWEVPDGRGHRYLVAMRTVRRPERFLGWIHEDQYQVQPPPHELLRGTLVSAICSDPVKAGAAYTQTRGMTVDCVIELDHLPAVLAIKDRLARRLIAITATSGEEYLARIINVRDDGKLKIQAAAEPTFDLPGTAFSIFNDGWFPIRVRPLLRYDEGEADVALPTYHHPQDAEIRFSYGLPPAGARSSYNQISAIRTGFKGVEHYCRFEPVDRTPPMADILRGIQVNGDPPTPFGLVCTQVGANPISRVDLDRHRRLLTISHMPACYSYQVSSRSLHEGRVMDPQRLARELLLPDSASAPYAERRPAQIGVLRPPAVECLSSCESCENDDRIRIHRARILLSRHVDHMEKQEKDAPLEHPVLPVGDPRVHATNSVSFPRLPDPFMRYRVSWRYTEEAELIPKVEPCDFLAFELLLPWSEGYEPRLDPNDPVEAMVRFSGVEGRGGDKIAWEPIRFDAGGEIPLFWVDVEFKVPHGENFCRPEQYVLQAYQQGREAGAIYFGEKEASE